MMEQVKEKEASQLASDLVAVGMMAPILLGGLAVGIGMLGAAIRYSLYGSAVDFGAMLTALDGQTRLIILAAIGLAYWVVFNYLFGENVDETLEQAEDAEDTVQETL